MDVYYNVYPGYYFTGDGAARDSEGFYWIRGRVDDVVNVSKGKNQVCLMKVWLKSPPATSAEFHPSSLLTRISHF